MKKTILILAVLASVSACNKNNGGSGNQPSTPSNTAVTPNGCNSSVPTSACVPYNSNNFGSYGNYGYGPNSGYLGYYQNQYFNRFYFQTYWSCPRGYMPVAVGPQQFLCMSYIYMYQQQIVPSQVPGAYIQGGININGGQVPADYNSYLQQQLLQGPSDYSVQNEPMMARQRIRIGQACNINQGTAGCGDGGLVCRPTSDPVDSSVMTGNGTCQRP